MRRETENRESLEECKKPSAKLRLRKMAKEAIGRKLDIGFGGLPNLYLSGEVIGFDLQLLPKPSNYSKVIVGDVGNINAVLKQEKFDSILAGEIIEHLENPVKFLRDCYNLLNRSGKLIISTPNPYYPPEIIFNWLMNKKYLYSKNHLFLFPPRWMNRILTYTGFKLEKILSGGIPLSNKILIPSPWFICHQIIYVAKKQ
jgi:SAM-dependent methyltransferase